MPRSISYSPLALAVAPGGQSPRGKKPDDDYQQRLLKYIPAETIAFFVPISAAVGDKSRSGLVVITLVAIVGNVIYSFIGKAPGGKTLPHYYVLSIIAFLVWALATNQNLADLIALSKLWTSIILGCTVFNIAWTGRSPRQVECLTFFAVDVMTKLERVVAYLERLQKKHIDKRRAAQQDDQLAGHLRAFAERMGADPAEVARLLREMRAVKETMYSRFEIIPWFWIISDIVKSVEKHLSETNTPAPKIVFGTLATGDINGQVIDQGNQEYLLVTLDDGTIAFANLLTKAVAENLPLKPGGSGLDVERDPQLIEQRINRDFNSHQRFCELFLHYAVNGDPHAAPAYDPLPEYIRLSTAWRRAMEFFIVSHEFGHACLGHLGTQERARIGHLDYSEIAFDWDKEFQADRFGLKTTLSILKQDNIDPGTIYAGIEMFFYGQEFLYRTRARFLGAEFADRGTNSHPPIELRLAHLRSVLKEYLNPAELAAASELCNRVRAMFDTLRPELERQIDLLRRGGTVVHKKWQPRRGLLDRVMELGNEGREKAGGGVSAAALR